MFGRGVQIVWVTSEYGQTFTFTFKYHLYTGHELGGTTNGLALLISDLMKIVNSNLENGKGESKHTIKTENADTEHSQSHPKRKNHKQK